MFRILIHGQISETVLSGLSEHVKITFTHLDLSLQMDNNNDCVRVCSRVMMLCMLAHHHFSCTVLIIINLF